MAQEPQSVCSGYSFPMGGLVDRPSSLSYRKSTAGGGSLYPRHCSDWSICSEDLTVILFTAPIFRGGTVCASAVLSACIKELSAWAGPGQDRVKGHRGRLTDMGFGGERRGLTFASSSRGQGPGEETTPWPLPLPSPCDVHSRSTSRCYV